MTTLRSLLYASASLLAGAAIASSQHHQEPHHGHHHGVAAPGYDSRPRSPDTARWIPWTRSLPAAAAAVTVEFTFGPRATGGLRRSPRSCRLRGGQGLPARERRRGRRHRLARRLRRRDEPHRERGAQGRCRSAAPRQRRKAALAPRTLKTNPTGGKEPIRSESTRATVKVCATGPSLLAERSLSLISSRRSQKAELGHGNLGVNLGTSVSHFS